MARTWTQVFFEQSTLGTYDKNICNTMLSVTDIAHTNFFYAGYDFKKVWQWHPNELLDISAGTFTGTSNITGLAWFNDDLYAAINETSSVGAIYRYNGSTGTNWTKVWDMVYGGIQGYFLSSGFRAFDADRERIAVVAYWPGLAPFPADIQLFDSFNGTDWIQVSLNGFGGTIYYVTGRALADQPGQLIGQCSDYTLVRPLIGAHTWMFLSTPGSIDFREYLANFGDIFTSWAEYNDPGPGDREFFYSTDWHSADYQDANLDGVNDLYFPRVKVLGSDAIFGYCGLNWVKVWNNSAKRFDADGSIPNIGGSVSVAQAFFRLGSNLYAAVDSSHGLGAGLLGLYIFQSDIGTTPTDNGQFYFGYNALNSTASLPFRAANPNAMALQGSLGTLVIGSANPDLATGTAVYATHPYTTVNLMETGLTSGTSVRAIRWI